MSADSFPGGRAGGKISEAVRDLPDPPSTVAVGETLDVPQIGADDGATWDRLYPAEPDLDAIMPEDEPDSVTAADNAQRLRTAAEDLAQLKAQWLDDPCWDIEDTEGFEVHREDLLAWRKKISDALGVPPGTAPMPDTSRSYLALAHAWAHVKVGESHADALDHTIDLFGYDRHGVSCEAMGLTWAMRTLGIIEIDDVHTTRLPPLRSPASDHDHKEFGRLLRLEANVSDNLLELSRLRSRQPIMASEIERLREDVARRDEVAKQRDDELERVASQRDDMAESVRVVTAHLEAAYGEVERVVGELRKLKSALRTLAAALWGDK